MDKRKVYICQDMDYIHSVLTSDDMWDRISDDYTRNKNSVLYNTDCLWLVCVKNGVNIGLSALESISNSSLDVHICIEKKHRGCGTIETGRAFIHWIKENAPKKIRKLNTKIPCVNKDVIRFAKLLGFAVEGVDTKSIMKNKKLIDRLYMGLSINRGEK